MINCMSRLQLSVSVMLQHKSELERTKKLYLMIVGAQRDPIIQVTLK